jgi:small subunit ribosomal protein S2
MDEIKNDKSGMPVEPVAPERTADTAVLEEMTKAGILFGRRRMWGNPKMKKYVYTTRNGFSIFDLTQTLDAIEKACEFLKTIGKNGQQVLFVGTTPASQALAQELGTKFGFPFVTERWLGGTLTNYDTISARLQFYLRLKADNAAGRLDKYTKKERTEMMKQLERLTRFFGGLERMVTLPAAVVVLGADAHKIAIAEASRAKIPVVAIANTNADPTTIKYVIPANDNNQLSLRWISEKLSAALVSGINERGAVAPIKK